MAELIENDAEMTNGAHDREGGFGSDDEDRANRGMGFGQMPGGRDDDGVSASYKLERSMKSVQTFKSAQSVGTSITTCTQKTYSGYR